MVITNAKISYICGILPSNKINNCDNELFECRIKNRIIQSSGVKNRYVLNRKNNESILSMENCKNWTSLAHIDIIMSLEEEFEIKFSKDELSQLKSQNELLKAIKEKLC